MFAFFESNVNDYKDFLDKEVVLFEIHDYQCKVKLAFNQQLNKYVLCHDLYKKESFGYDLKLNLTNYFPVSRIQYNSDYEFFNYVNEFTKEILISIKLREEKIEMKGNHVLVVFLRNLLKENIFDYGQVKTKEINLYNSHKKYLFFQINVENGEAFHFLMFAINNQFQDIQHFKTLTNLHGGEDIVKSIIENNSIEDRKLILELIRYV